MAQDANGVEVKDGDLVTFRAKVLHVGAPSFDNKPTPPDTFRVVTQNGEDCAGPVFQCDSQLASVVKPEPVEAE